MFFVGELVSTSPEHALSYRPPAAAEVGAVGSQATAHVAINPGARADTSHLRGRMP